jgi:ATP-dependent Clp protease ATP-binding subunit ClpC
MVQLPFTPHIEGVLQKSKDLSVILERNGVDLDILFHCFISDLSLSCTSIFKKIGVDGGELIKDSRNILHKKRKNKNISDKFKTDARKFLKFCEKLCKDTYSLDYIPPEVMLMNFFDEQFTPKVLKESFPEGVEAADSVRFGIVAECALVIKDFEAEKIESRLKELEETPDNWIDMFDNNEILSQFAENLNAKAAAGEFDKIVDYDGKIDELATILCRKKKPNAILVGPAGTGKTSLVEGLATKIAAGDAPELIANKVIYSVSLSSMVAGTEYRGQFEKRLEDFVNEAKKYTNLILFIDEIHTLIGAGGANNNSLEASNILKPELARGTISCIGATTINEYTNTIKKDTALDRRFERVVVKEPSKFQMEEILPTIVSYYETFHGVEYSDEFLNNIIKYCEKYTPNKYYPDKAIDVIDHCGAQAKVTYWDVKPSIKEMQTEIVESALHPEKDHSALIEKLNKSLEKWVESDETANKPEVTRFHLKEFFDRKVNPLNKKSKINKVFDCFSKSFVGQADILEELKHEIILSSIGVRTTRKFSTPECYVISGEESSGKSLFCELLEDSLQKHGVNVLSYNGIHFSDNFSPHKIASSQGNNTSICEKIVITPNSVLIIDDFHKIDKTAVPIFNQILKEGKIQMNNGDVADFSNCKIFLTSCLSHTSQLGFNIERSRNDDPLIHKDIYSLVKNSFILNELKTKDLRRILWNKLRNIKANLEDNGVYLDFTVKYISNNVEKIKDEASPIKSLNELVASKIKPFISECISNGNDKIKLFVEK